MNDLVNQIVSIESGPMQACGNKFGGGSLLLTYCSTPPAPGKRVAPSPWKAEQGAGTRH